MNEYERFDRWAREYTGEHQLRYSSGQKWGEYADEIRPLFDAWQARADLATEEIEALKHDNERLMDSLNRCEALVDRAAEREREFVDKIEQMESDMSGLQAAADAVYFDGLAKIDKEKRNE